MNHDLDLAIVGAGAAGLTAAIFARQANPELVIAAFDGAARIGAKILISGGGRCNVTHDVVTPADFNGNRNAIGRVLRSFPVDATVAWFASMGVELKREEGGKLFPVTDRARRVLDALLSEASGVEIVPSARVEAIEPGERFRLVTSRGEFHARRVILATGGRSVPKTGSDGQGYSLAHAMGHTVTEIFPALVPLVVEGGHWTTSLSGTSVAAELEVQLPSGRVVARSSGSLLFTHFGVSGPVALDISRHWVEAKRHGEHPRLVANVIGGESDGAVDALLLGEAKRNPRATVPSALRGRVPERLLSTICEPHGATAIAQLPRDERRRIVRALTALEIPVVRDRGFDYAEVTAGGVPLSEIDLATMESRRCRGLYLCGEILDVDGRIGGYNFQWAWTSGRLAGLAAAAGAEGRRARTPVAP